jgi:hypothetical protein
MSGRLVPRTSISPQDESAMYALLQKDFEGISLDQFRKDLDEKNWVILLKSRRGSGLGGFTTLHFYDVEYRGRTLSIVYSGDTVVDRSSTESSALSQTWIRDVNLLRRQHAKGPLYWFLLSSGYRTYRFLPLYYRRFYPRYDAPTPPSVQELIDFLATQRFGRLYHRKEGIVRFPVPQILRGALRGIPARRLGDPHIAFFAARNPGHERGDELVCLTEIVRENLTRAGERMWTLGEGSSSEAGRLP